MKIDRQKEELKTKTYLVEPYVTVTEERFRVRVDKNGVQLEQWDSPTQYYKYARGYPFPLDLVKRAIEEWEKL